MAAAYYNLPAEALVSRPRQQAAVLEVKSPPREGRPGGTVKQQTKEKKKGPASVPSSHSPALAEKLKSQRALAKSIRKACKEQKVQRLPDDHELSQQAKALLTEIKTIREREKQASKMQRDTAQVAQPEQRPAKKRSISKDDSAPKRAASDIQPSSSGVQEMEISEEKSTKYWDSIKDLGYGVGKPGWCDPFGDQTTETGQPRYRYCGLRKDSFFSARSGRIQLVSFGLPGGPSAISQEEYRRLGKDDRKTGRLPDSWKIWVFKPEDPIFSQAVTLPRVLPQ